MFCKKCGSRIDDGSKYCPNCGAFNGVSGQDETNAAPPRPYYATVGKNDLCAIIGFILAFIAPEVGLPFCILGRRNRKYRKLATAGLIISIILLVAYIALLIWFIALTVAINRNYDNSINDSILMLATQLRSILQQ